MLDDLARDDNVEPSRRREVRIDELAVVAELHHVGDRDVADLRQRCDMAVVETPPGTVDEDVEAGAPEDVDRHVRHVELTAGTFQATRPRRVANLLDVSQRAVVIDVLGVPDEAADTTREHPEGLARRAAADVRRVLANGEDPCSRTADHTSGRKPDGAPDTVANDPRPGKSEIEDGRRHSRHRTSRSRAISR